MIPSNPSPVEHIQSTEPTPFPPSYTPSPPILPPSYTTHSSDKLLSSSSSSSSSSPPHPIPTEAIIPPPPQPTIPPHTQPKPPSLLAITAHLRLKIHRRLLNQHLHRFLLTFLLLNTALFVLLVYYLDQASIVTYVGAESGICVCPLKQRDGCYGSLNGVVGEGEGIFGRVEYEKLEIWRRCVREVRRVREWREWVLWVVMPAQCLVETLAAWAWWWCLREEEREEERGREAEGGMLLEESEEGEGYRLVDEEKAGLV